MQSQYYDSGTGMYKGGSLWTDANSVENVHNLMLAANNDDFAGSSHSVAGRV